MTKKEISQDEIRVGRRIKELRKDVLGLDSQQVFADRLGNVTRGAVGNWERGQGIKRENLRRIADVFRVSFDWLATGRGTPHASDQPMDSIEQMIADALDILGEEEAEALREDFKRQITERKNLIERLRPAPSQGR